MSSGTRTSSAKSRVRAPYPSTGDPPHRPSRRRQAEVIEPAPHAHVEGHGNIVAVVVGSGSVSINAHFPYLRLTHFEARTKRARGDGSDAALLSAYRTDVVPLLGRDNAVQDLQHWIACDRDLSVRVLTGGAGRGKTRLALELVRNAAERGWLAGFVEQGELDRFRAHENVAEW